MYSETRSSLPSPAQSRKSGTDEEVELLLKASYSSLSKDYIDNPPNPCGPVGYTQVSPKKRVHSDYSKYDGFFELLGNLDLELPTQSLKTESRSESTFVDTGLDAVTTELEEWMKDFEFPSGGTDDMSGSCQPPSDETLRADLGCQQLPDESVRVESAAATTKLHGPCIPSHRSAFSVLVDGSNEDSTSYSNNEQDSKISSFSCHNSSAERNETSGYLGQQHFPVPFVNDCVRDNMSVLHTRFMSPTASAASEDSGYNEDDNKALSNLGLTTGEENLKASSKMYIHSSLKNLDDTTKDVPGKPSYHSSFEKLLEKNLDWPAVSGAHTLTVLPAMVTTGNNFTDNPQELLRVSSITEASRSGEICTVEQHETERTSFNTDMLDGGPQAPSEPCEDYEHGIMLSENYGNASANESCTVSIPEPCDASVVPQPSECLVSEGSSHSRLSEPENVSENGGDNALSLDTTNALSLDTPSVAAPCSEESENKRARRERNKTRKFESLGDLSATKNISSGKNCTNLDSNGASRTRDGGCWGGKGKRRKVKRRRNRFSKLGNNEGVKQNVPLRKRALKKSVPHEQPKRPGKIRKVLPHSARRQASFRDNQPSTSSGEKYPANNSVQERHERDDRGVFTTQNLGWQTPDGRTNHRSSR